MPETTVSIPVDLRPDSQWVPKPSGRGGRFVNAHQAHLGPFGGYARSAADAKRSLVDGVTKFAEQHRPVEMFHLAGWTAVVWCEPCDLDGIRWIYQLIWSEGPRSSRTMTGDYAKARSSARYAVADAVASDDYWDQARVEMAAAWLGDNGDDWRHGSESLLRYAAWQRAYRHGDSIGEADPHRWAGDHEKDFLDRWDKESANA